MPKSVSCGSPYSVSRMFAGLTSRCRVPRRCAVSKRTRHLHPECRASRQPMGPLSLDLGVQRTVRVILHHDVGPPGGGGADLEDADDVRMSGQLCPSRLARARIAPDSPARGLRSEPYRDRPVQRALAAAINDAETAAPDLVGLLESGSHQLRRDPDVVHPAASATGRCGPSLASKLQGHGGTVATQPEHKPNCGTRATVHAAPHRAYVETHPVPRSTCPTSC